MGVAGGGLAESALPSRVLAVEQSNSSIIYGERVFLKLYRRLEEGVNPDAEILRFLGSRGFPHVPPFRGALEFRRAGREPQVLALATGMVPNDGDAWSFTLRELTRELECVLTGDGNGRRKSRPHTSRGRDSSVSARAHCISRWQRTRRMRISRRSR